MNEKGSSYVRRKRKESKFTQLSNSMLRDDRLSWKSRGLLAYMLSMPDDWVFYETELVKHSEKDGITSLRSAMKELKSTGYVKKEAVKGDNGKIVKWITYVDEDPVHITGNLQSGKPTIKEIHNVEDSTLLIPISTKTEETNIKPSPKYKISDMDNAKLLFELMKNHNPDAKEPNFETWANDMRKIRELDNRTDEQIKYLINWCQNDDFWFVNILSPSKLRTKWDQLVLKVKQSNNKTMQNKQKSSILEELANGYSTNGTNTINGQNSLPQQIESRREGISWDLL